ncbi:MAG: UMP kinase [Candidatus Methanofastidiosia archaeon]
MKIVIKYGGSLLFKNGDIEIQRIDEVCSVIRTLVDGGNDVGLVIGGGATARKYISSLSQDYPEASKDYVAVLATRLNAMLFISRLDDICCPYPPTNYEEIVACIAANKIIISGGMQPGQSTNAVATLLCEAMGATHLVNASNVDYVYDKDPQKYKDAKPQMELTYAQLQKIISSSGAGAGQYEMFDTVAAKNLARSKITLNFVNGSDPKNILKLLSGEKKGTIVRG